MIWSRMSCTRRSAGATGSSRCPAPFVTTSGRATQRCVVYGTGGGSSVQRSSSEWGLSNDAARSTVHGGAAMTENLGRAFAGRRVLVTGGAGFVGGALVRRLAEAGARVTVLDDLFTGRAEIVPTTAELVQGSVVDEVLVRQLVGDA